MTTSACVIGLGKLGSPLAACLAAKGINTVGVDVDPHKIEALNRGESPVHEPGMEQMLARAGKRLTATQHIEVGVCASEITFIVVSTPSESDGGFSLRYVLPACEAIGRALAAKSEYHVVVLTSTVMPGTTGGPVREALERASGKKCGEDFGLCYSPEFIALGSVIRDFLNPDMLLIGESDARAGSSLESLYLSVVENKPSVARMNWVNAEITKLAVNTYVTTKISFANMLARVAERLPGANVDVITSALGLDTRIGPKYLKGAISYGGPCFPRDNLAMSALARKLGAPADLSQTVDMFNRGQVRWLAEVVESHLHNGGRVGILGLTYKPSTDVVEEAVGFLLAKELLRRGKKVIAYDPAGQGNTAKVLGESVAFASKPEECVRQSDVVVLATPWQEFSAIALTQWGRPGNPRVVVDCWRVLKQVAGQEGVRYVGLGMGATG
ncbi:MAG: UDP-glucose/GDP-mannose dehydrogenase family protein [Acidobacteria bacterium]|nr:UDP-glucose/GDP-mannose dehydrogenase family protein [Acidobacteriota bacterium]